MGPAFCEGEAEPGPDVRPAGSDVTFEAEGETEMTPDPKGFETGAAPPPLPQGSMLSTVGCVVPRQLTELWDGNGTFLPK